MENITAMPGKAHQALAAFMRGGRLSHAILIEGPGRDKFARHIARGALCVGDEKPCGECSHCRKAEKGVHPDILTYGGNGSFPVDLVREIRSQAFIMPNEADRKAFILEEIQDMTPQAQNALLKILEEPPGGVIFLLTCDNKARLLSTVLSRATVLSLEGESAMGGEERDEAALLLREACTGSEYAALALLQKYEKNREGFIGLCAGMRHVMEEVLLEREGCDSLLARRMTRLQCAQIIAIIEELEYTASRNANLLLLATALPGRIRMVMERAGA